MRKRGLDNRLWLEQATQAKSLEHTEVRFGAKGAKSVRNQRC